MKKRLLLISIVTVLLVITVIYLTFCSKYLRIKHIQIKGGERVNLPTVKSLADTCIGANIFTVSLNNLKQTTIHLPWVKEVKIIKKLPSTLTVQIDERKAFGIVNLPDRGCFWIGREGHVLEKIDIEKEKLTDRKVIVSGIGTVDTPEGERIKQSEHISIVQNLMGMGPQFLDRFKRLKLEGGDAILEAVKGYRVLLKTTKFKAKLNILNKLLNKIDGSRYRYIDLRFFNQVILAPRKY